MTYVVTQNCCSDASCVVVCPVGCIHPTPDEPGFATAEMLYIDPDTCVDCGACADACPVDAIRPDTALAADDHWYIRANTEYYQSNPPSPEWYRRQPRRIARVSAEGLRVAIVGSGAAGFYAATALLRHPGVRVDMYEKLSAPHGLIRYGVAPDHPATKAVAGQFRWPAGQQKRFTLHLGVEVGGAGLSHEVLLDQHHAVIYASGSAGERRLDIPGEDLPGVIGALPFVGWYNGHPDHARLAPDLTGRRAVVIGNGNVALDLARILTADPDALAATDIAKPALSALRGSAIDEVVILGRRGAAHAAFTTPELYALSRVPGLDVIVDPEDAAHGDGPKLELLRELAARPATGVKRIVIRFNAAPVEIVGDGVAAGVRLSTGEFVEAGLVLRSIGFGGAMFDTVAGRVSAGVYATGWARRGPSGGIGTNRTCAEETVDTLLADYAAGALSAPRRPEPVGRRLRLWPVRSHDRVAT
ncbi:FAD-dependent oxidoreductase [Mycolicibacterium brisbanense]